MGERIWRSSLIRCRLEDVAVDLEAGRRVSVCQEIAATKNDAQACTHIKMMSRVESRRDERRYRKRDGVDRPYSPRQSMHIAHPTKLVVWAQVGSGPSSASEHFVAKFVKYTTRYVYVFFILHINQCSDSTYRFTEDTEHCEEPRGDCEPTHL